MRKEGFHTSARVSLNRHRLPTKSALFSSGERVCVCVCVYVCVCVCVCVSVCVWRGEKRGVKRGAFPCLSFAFFLLALTLAFSPPLALYSR